MKILPKAPAFPSRSTRELLDLGYVAPLPAVARCRIKDRYACSIGPLGHDCAGISNVRETIALLDPERKHRNALFVTATHTHWNDRPIIESYEPESASYIVGPSEVTSELAPYSFVFSREGPVAVEWLDETVPIVATEFEQIYEFIWRLNDLIAKKLHHQLPIPIGIMIDHRFKRSIWDARMYSFIEGDSHEHDGRAVVRPVFESLVRPNQPVPGTIRVAWSSYPPAECTGTKMSAVEEGFYVALETQLQRLDPYDAQSFLDGLERNLVQSAVQGAPHP